MVVLAAREAAVLAVLRAAGGRVVSRADLARAAGLDGLSERRVDGVLVRLRRALPEGALLTVRGRGWSVVPELVTATDVHPIGTSRKRVSPLPETPGS
ncbi:MAG: hypothetical protein JWN08_2879 [Frankiales bacterium]|nr:hypothetical protein [Frankiales bacterium]